MFFFKRKKKAQEELDINEKSEIKEIGLVSQNIKSILGSNSDFTVRELAINGMKDIPVSLMFIDGLIDIKTVNDSIIKPLIQEASLGDVRDVRKIISLIERGTIYHASQKTRDTLKDCIGDIMDGSVAIVFDSVKKAVTFDVKGYEKRAITEPTNENVIKGAKDAFVENLRTNTATIRRKIKTHDLIIEETIVGKQSLTKVAIIYIKDLTNKNMVEELKKRLNTIHYDNALSSGIIEEGITDNKYSVFPQFLYTERPDKFCTSIVQGRAGVIVDGIPLAMLIPYSLMDFIQAPEDYSQNFIVSSAIRLVRIASMLITLLLPGFYTAVMTFHQEMLPTELAIAIKSTKEGVPFPSFMEVIFMLLAFEIMIEAGLRLPKSIGQTVSIVGAIVVGQAAIEAKLLSPAVVVTIALTAISSFTMPNQDFANALRVWRFLYVILASILGLYALSLGLVILLISLAKMEIFGVPYLAPFVAEDSKQMQDTLIRPPFTSMYKRPISLKTSNKKRLKQE